MPDMTSEAAIGSVMSQRLGQVSLVTQKMILRVLEMIWSGQQT